MTNYEKAEIPICSKDGARNAITVYTPSSAHSNVVLLLLPAMGVSADYYEPLALACVSSGWHAVTADLRGVGQSSVRASRTTQFGHNEMIHCDWPAIVEAVRTRFPAECLYLLGHSLGGQLSALYLSANPACADGLILVASCSVHFWGWDFPRNIGVFVSTQMIRLIAAFLGYFPGKTIGFGGIESGKVIKDWAYEALTGRYKIPGSPLDFEELLRRMRLPVLAISFDDDHFAPERAVRNLCNKMSGTQLTHRHFKPQDIGEQNLGHFLWVKKPAPVIREIEKWMRKLQSCGREDRLSLAAKDFEGKDKSAPA
ncbi:MAG: alpha/beta fold hydrolase [Desulfomonile tiedjei]|uniref:Alpha/beta fold hydrolase n=1 Tax=Desulfomonile tiedjei TaxID=2358 RepID=A0A9D6V3Y5_9BACT|nr:alpha/beta fold hydrolase [Desulfomonile tiedjei]